MNNIVRLEFKDYKLVINKQNITAIDYYDNNITIYTTFGEEFGFNCDEKTAEEILILLTETERVTAYKKEEIVKDNDGIFKFPIPEDKEEEGEEEQVKENKNIPKMINKSFEGK